MVHDASSSRLRPLFFLFALHWEKLEALQKICEVVSSHTYVSALKIIHNLIDIPANTHLISLSSDHNSHGYQRRFKQPMKRID